MSGAPTGGAPMSGEPTSELVELASSIAREAGALLLGYYEGAAPSEGVAASAQSKSTRTDLVTEADRASEQLVLRRLAEERPDDAVVAEEGGARKGSSGVTWVVDPLDGTINFVYGFPAFAVSIGCEHAGRRVAGAVYDPVRDELFAASLGSGATLNGTPLELGNGPPLDESLVATGFGYDAGRRLDQARLLETVLPSVRDIRRAGAAALDLCWVAAGRLDAMYEAGLAAWDLAAGALVVTEAGGAVEILEGIVPGADTLVAGTRDVLPLLMALLRDARHAADARRSTNTGARRDTPMSGH
jgi:myo-inositol-1(or 4)-monophosphatase